MLKEERWYQELMTVSYWAYLPLYPPIELPVTAYSDAKTRLIYFIDLHGDRALMMLERESELARLSSKHRISSIWGEYVWLNLEEFGLPRWKVVDRPVLTPKEAADVLMAHHDISEAADYARKQVEIIRPIAGLFLAGGMDTDLVERHQYWHEIFKILAGHPLYRTSTDSLK